MTTSQSHSIAVFSYASIADAVNALGRPQTELELCKVLVHQWSRILTGDVSSEARLFDRSRVDILTPHVAFEVDWADKWTEAVGQALYYATITRRRPGIILLVESRDRDLAYLQRCQLVCLQHKIELLFFFLQDRTVVHDGRTIQLS